MSDNAEKQVSGWTAERTVDVWPIEYRTLVFALIDQLNVVRALLPAPLAALTRAQAIAIATLRTTAGTP